MCFREHFRQWFRLLKTWDLKLGNNEWNQKQSAFDGQRTHIGFVSDTLTQTKQPSER